MAMYTLSVFSALPFVELNHVGERVARITFNRILSVQRSRFKFHITIYWRRAIINMKLAVRMASIKHRKNVSKKPVWGEPISYEVLSFLPFTPLLLSFSLSLSHSLDVHEEHTRAASPVHCDTQSFSRMLRC